MTGLQTKYFGLWMSFLLSLNLSACQPKPTESSQADTHPHHHGTEQSTEQTQTLIQQAGPLQVTFDISTFQAHQTMMQQMQMSASSQPEASHYVLVTLSDPEARKPVQAEELRLKLIAPDGQAIGDAAGLIPETFSGQGMFHYGHALNAEIQGTYEILVMFRWEEQIYSTGVSWQP